MIEIFGKRSKLQTCCVISKNILRLFKGFFEGVVKSCIESINSPSVQWYNQQIPHHLQPGFLMLVICSERKKVIFKTRAKLNLLHKATSYEYYCYSESPRNVAQHFEGLLFNVIYWSVL